MRQSICLNLYEAIEKLVELGLEAKAEMSVTHLEGLVSKRADRPYRGGRSPDWIKVKNR